MAFVPRTREQIRSDFLTAWATRYTTSGRVLATWEGSPPYLQADAFAVSVATIEQQALNVTRDMLPDQAQGAALTRHGVVWDVTQRTASAALLTILLTGVPLAVIAFTTSKLRATNGLLFSPNVAGCVLDASGNAYITFTADTEGIGGNLIAGSVLTWDSTPVGLNATGTVTGAPFISGSDAETTAQYQQRILDTLRGRPASGNRADWKDWVEACEGVEQAYVYPLCNPTPISPVSTHVLGCVRVVALGPAQGSGAVNTRLLTVPRCAEIKDYIEGLRDVYGSTTATGEQLRPVCMGVLDYQIEPGTPYYVPLRLKVTNSAQYAYPWAGSHVITSAAATFFKVAGDQTALVNLAMLVPVGSAARGGYQYTIPGTAVFAAGVTTFSGFSPALAGTPTIGGTVYPGAPNAQSIQQAIFNLYDLLGPNNVDPSGQSARWPNEDSTGRATLYLSAVIAAVQGCPGVLSVLVYDGFGAPYVDTSPTASTLEIVTLSDLLIYP